MIERIEEWLLKEPRAREVIKTRHEDGEFTVTIEYGDRTMVTGRHESLSKALAEALDRAEELPSAARTQERRRNPDLLPGM